ECVHSDQQASGDECLWLNLIAQHQQSVAGEPATAPKADANSSRGYLSRRAMSRHFRRTELWNVRRRSLRLNARELHHLHLGPFLNVLGDELAELGGRTCKRRVAKVCKPRLHRGIGKNGALISLLSFSTISGGVFFGAPIPSHVLAS